MSTSQIFESSILPFGECTERKGIREVTYQIALKGCNGIVIASDRCELSAPSDEITGIREKNFITKILISANQQFAIAFSGGSLGLMAAHRIQRNLNADPNENIYSLVEKSELEAVDRHKETGQSPGKSEVVIVSGTDGEIYRSQINRCGPEKIMGSFYKGGQSLNAAGVFTDRLYSQSMDVYSLASLAAYTIWAAHKISPNLIDGLDIAIYDYSVGKFEFQNAEIYTSKTSSLDDSLRSCFRPVRPTKA